MSPSQKTECRPVSLADGEAACVRDQPCTELLANLGALATATPEQQANRENEVYRLTRDPETYEVKVESDITLEDMERITDPEDWGLIQEWAAPLVGRRAVFINPTMEGGGVAMIRPTVVHMLNLLGVDAHWYVMEPIKDPSEGNPFLVTKKIHNITQRVPTSELTEEDKALHWKWADGENGPVLERQENILTADFIVIDDPQPAPLIARLKKVNPTAKFIWRDHIDSDNKLKADLATPQGKAAYYVKHVCHVNDVNAVMAHPVESFVDNELYDKTYFTPATYDKFDNLNKHLTEEKIVEGMEFINAEIKEQNKWLIKNGFTPMEPLSLDPNKMRLTLIARFCPSKGMEKAIEMGILTRQMMRDLGVPEDQLPEIVMIGNGSQDDTDGPRMYEEILRLREQYPDDIKSIIVMRLKHNYDAINALVSRSSIVMQTSLREGLETRASDAINHGKITVVSNRGGIKTQIKVGKSGIVLDFNKPDFDLKRGASFMSKLLTRPDVYAKMAATTKKQGEVYNSREFVTAANVARLLRIFNDLTGNPVTTVDKKTWLMSDFVAAAKETKQIAA